MTQAYTFCVNSGLGSAGIFLPTTPLRYGDNSSFSGVSLTGSRLEGESFSVVPTRKQGK